MAKKSTKHDDYSASVTDNISGSNNRIGGHHETNYNGLNQDELVAMIEARFQHLLRKDSQIEAIFEENRKLTDEVIRQNADFRMYNEAFRKLHERIAELTDRNIELANKVIELGR